MKAKKSLCGEFCNYHCQKFVVIVSLQKLCDFKMDLIKWQLNFKHFKLGKTVKRYIRNSTKDSKMRNNCSHETIQNSPDKRSATSNRTRNKRTRNLNSK